jgi:hypothetical protein
MPSSGGELACQGCIAAVRSAQAHLGKELASEDRVQELFEQPPRVCAAVNFEEEEQNAWSLPPPETSRACSAFVQVRSRGVCASACERVSEPACFQP